MARKILIIDDDQDLLDMLAIVFDGMDCEVITSNRELSDQEIIAARPDLVLLDIQIVGSARTGDQICSSLKQQDKNMKILLISSETDIQSIATHCHADGFINKPFDINYLKDTVGASMA